MDVLLTPESLENLFRNTGIRIGLSRKGLVISRGWIRLVAVPSDVNGCSIRFNVSGFPPFALVCLYMKMRDFSIMCGWNYVWINVCDHIPGMSGSQIVIADVRLTDRGLLISVDAPGGRELGF